MTTTIEKTAATTDPAVPSKKKSHKGRNAKPELIGHRCRAIPGPARIWGPRLTDEDDHQGPWTVDALDA